MTSERLSEEILPLKYYKQIPPNIYKFGMFKDGVTGRILSKLTLGTVEMAGFKKKDHFALH